MSSEYDGTEEILDPDRVPIYVKPLTAEEEAATARYRKRLAERVKVAGKPAIDEMEK